MTSVPFIRVGVFYDGGFFSHASDFYLYHHSRHRRLSIQGLHEYVREHLAEVEQVPVERCRIVEAHYVRGRMSARDAAHRERLLAERQWDETLLRLGVTPYYLPLSSNGSSFEEKGVDVWFALEAYDRARDGRFDVAVLVACDGDYTPLARKLQRVGVRVLVVGGDFNGGQSTRTSRRLLGEATYAFLLNEVVDDPQRADDPRVLRLFMGPRDLHGGLHTSSDRVVEAGGAAGEQPRETAVGQYGGEFVESGEVVREFTGDAEATDEADVMNTPMELDGSLEMPMGEMSMDLSMDLAIDDDAVEAPLSSQRMHGVIWKLKEGFGFAKVAGLPRDVFFHYSALTDRHFNDLTEGEAVAMLVTENSRGYVASRVMPNSPPPAMSRWSAPRTPSPRHTPTAALGAIPPAVSDDEGYPL